MVIKMLKGLVKRLPPIKRLSDELSMYRRQQFVPPGHFYSPIPSLDEIMQNEEKIFRINSKYLPGIDLNEEEQLRLFKEFKTYYKDLQFKENKVDNLRYFYENPSYSYSDAIFLYCMIRHLKPRRIIEVGSGYSSCVILDTNEIHFNNTISCTFIEPYPQLLESLITNEDKKRIETIAVKLQDVELSRFKCLSADDILFIDSTHVSKVNSDVNRVFFEILPSLNSGVYIHFHDIFFPFEYPRAWIYQGISWNEDYMLKAFLQYNTSFETVFFNTFLEHFYKDKFEKDMPLCLKNKGGSIWIKKK